jgi:MtN3 and saliva related transmembrane protein
MVKRIAKGMAVEIPWISMIGTVAGMATTGAFLPQVVRAWRTRSTHDISLSMFLLTVFGLILWFIYGLVLNDWPLILTDAVSLILAGTVVGLKLCYG